MQSDRLASFTSFAYTDRIFDVADADVFKEFSQYGADAASFIVDFHALDGSAITPDHAWKVTVACACRCLCVVPHVCYLRNGT